MVRTMRGKKGLMLQTLKETLGIITTATTRAGICRKTHYNWYHTDSEYARQVDEILESQKDLVESQLLQLIIEKHPQSIMFYLKTKAGDRGYKETRDISINQSETLTEEELKAHIKSVVSK